jgi:hypothetical protein
MTNDFRKRIEEEIKKRKKRPKELFVLKRVLLVLAFFILLFLGIILATLFFLRMRLSRPLLFLTLGRVGIRPFFVGFPWLFLLLFLIVLFAVEAIGVKEGPLFKKPLIFSIILFLILFLVFGFSLSCHKKSRQEHFLDNWVNSPTRVMSGAVGRVEEDYFFLEPVREGLIKVLLPPRMGPRFNRRPEEGWRVEIMFDEGLEKRPLWIKRMK